MTCPRVLLVEDCPSDGRKLVKELVSRNCDVVLECDGVAAIKRIHDDAAPFDLVCLDIQMDVTASRYTAAVMRAIGYRGPIMTLSPYADRGPTSERIGAATTDCPSDDKLPAQLGRLLEDLTAGSRTPTCSQPAGRELG